MSASHNLSDQAHQYSAGETVYFLSHGAVETGSVTTEEGTNLWVDTGDTTRSFHRFIEGKGAYTAIQLAGIVPDLLPTPQSGEEVSLAGILKGIVKGEKTSTDVALRLRAATIAKELGADPTLKEYGVETVPSIVGSVDEAGSNSWLVQDVLSLYLAGRYNQNEPGKRWFLLARHTPDVNLLPTDQKKEIKKLIYDSNRAALDVIYETHEVDYTAAHVYERESESYDGISLIERYTYYPSPALGIYFTEVSHFKNEGEITPEQIPRYMSASVTTGPPRFPSIDDSFWPVA